MALILKAGNAYVWNSCRSLYISELTGVYNAETNTGGWGAPNAVTGDILHSKIIVTFPNGTTIVEIEDPTGFPTSDDEFVYEITAAVLGGTSIADGLYQIEYIVYNNNDDEVTYTTGSQYFLFTCNTQCCVDQLFAKIATDDDCSCNSYTVKNALYASALLKGLIANKDCGNITNMNSLITKLNTICNNSSNDCGCN